VQLSNWVSTQRQEYKLYRKGRRSRLTHERLEQLQKIDFVWEAQRGGPRKKHRATVAVPKKANPVNRVGPSSEQYPCVLVGSRRGGRGGMVHPYAGMPFHHQGSFPPTDSGHAVLPYAFQQPFPRVAVPPGMNFPSFVPMATRGPMGAPTDFSNGMMAPGLGSGTRNYEEHQPAGAADEADTTQTSQEFAPNGDVLWGRYLRKFSR
jgi:hypothetical protein